MANKELESTVLSIEVETSVDKEGNPKFTKKKLGNLVPGADPNKVMAVADKIAPILKKNTGYIYITEVSQLTNNNKKKGSVKYGIYINNDIYSRKWRKI